MSRKNINDYLTNDRAVARDLRAKGTSYSSSWDDWKGSAKAGSMSNYKFSPRCYETHKPLVMPNSKVKIYGSSCASPMINDADIYIGFDSIMKMTPRHYPWTKGHEIQFLVSDMSAPKDVANYHKLVEWTKKQLEAGAKVHAGCIGGHGRTGMFFAALVSLYGEQDAITYVRQNYCQKAVESFAQIEFLKKEYGVTPVTASKQTVQSQNKKVTTVNSVHDLDELDANRTYKPLTGETGVWGTAFSK